MKNLFGILFLVCVYSSSFSQSQTYSDIPRHSFEGVKTFDGKLFYTTHYGAPLKDIPYNYVIQIFNSELKRVTQEVIPVKYLSSIADIAPHNGGLICYLQSAKEGLVYSFDATGKLLWKKTLVLEKAQHHNVKILSLGQDGFVIVRPDELKKDGFRVTRYDNNLTEKWTQAYFPEKGSIDFSMARLTGDRVGVMARFMQSVFSTKFEERLYMFSVSDGSLVYEKVIINEQGNGKPKELFIGPDGSAFVIGYTFDPAKSFGEVVTHLFYQKLDASGNVLYDKKLTMEGDLKDKLMSEMGRNAFGFNTTPLIHFEDISTTDKGIRVLGETYRYIKTPVAATPGATTQISQPGKLYIMDYVLLEINEKGALAGTRLIAKPYKRIDAEGHTLGAEYTADDYFAPFGLFSFRYLTTRNGQPELVSHNWSRNTPYFGFTSLEVNHENILNRIYLNRSVAQGDAGQFSAYYFKKEGMQTPLQTCQYDILPYHQPGKMVFYDYSNEELTMEVMNIEVKNPVPAGSELALTGIPGSQFRGIMPVDGRGYYTFYYGEPSHNNTSLYIYHRLDEQLNTLGRSVLSVPNSAVFTGNVASGKSQVMVFHDAGERTWYFYELNETGKLVTENSVSLDKGEKVYPTGNLQIGTAPEGFYLLQTYWDEVKKVNGILVIRLGASHQVRWTWSYLAEKDEALQLVASQSNAGLFAILHTQRPVAGWNKFLNRITVLDDNTGKQLYDHDLYDGQDSGFPEYVMIAPDKSVVTSGMYFKGNKFDSQNSDGIFFLKLKPDGTTATYLKTLWKDVEGALKVTGGSDFLVSGKVKVLIQDMVMMPDGSFRVIGELYKKSVGTTGLGLLMGEDLGDRAFSIYDFIVFDYNQGKLASVYRIPKAEQNIELPGSIGQQKGLSLSLMMRNYNMFSYLKTLQSAGQPYIAYTNTIDRSKYVFSAPVAQQTAAKHPQAPAQYVIPKSPDDMNQLDRINTKLENLGYKLDKAVTGTDQTFTYFNDPYRGFAMAFTGKVLVYYYDPDARTLFLKLETLK
ncbi:MAG TPA: hypothetical protein P5228_05855 [Bacteroidales bacterium]|nr:hypothetical protein [Bacteroidales bacterium]HRZ50220.1 hypothetical protein [Bacteroidales bacterium]